VRKLSPDEATLWAKVTATIRPLSRDPVEAPEPAESPASAVAARPRGRVPPTRPQELPPERTKILRDATLDGGWDRRLRTGRVEPDRTLDLHGHSLDRAWVEIDRALDAFRGTFVQQPPAYSAKKVGGRKFYEMARKGESVPVVPKKVRVNELSFGGLKDGRLPFTISCSSGTYIRSIASELGEKLGCGAHLESLRRTRIGQFHVGDAVTLDGFEAMTPAERMAPPHAVSLSRVQFPFERVRLASLETWKIRKGQSIPARGVASREGDWVALVGPSDEMVALGQVTPMGNRGVALIRPKLVLAE